MPVISFISSKGGAGKSTSAMVLAQALANQNVGVSLIDADPNQDNAGWGYAAGPRACLTIYPSSQDAPQITENTIQDVIEEASTKDPFVLVDLEGTASLLHSYAIAASDFVIIPMQGKYLDAKQTAKVVGLIRREGRARRREIPHAVIITREPPAIKPRALKRAVMQLDEHGIEQLYCRLAERDAYDAIYSASMTLYELTQEIVNNPTAAIREANDFAAAVVMKMRKLKEAVA